MLFDQMSIDDVVERLGSVESSSPYSYLVTPNVDHLVRLDRLRDDDQRSREVIEAYRGADLCVCDSRVLARLARLAGVPLSVVPGSDLTVRLFETVVRNGDRIAIIGGDQAMMNQLRTAYPLLVFKQHVPPMGVRDNQAAMAAAASFAAASQARFLLLAIGSPQQEILAHRISLTPGAGGLALCIGAAVEFVSGQRKRAPRLLQKMSLEWSYRLASEPRRLWRRYIVDGPRIVPMLIRWRLQRGRPSS